MKNELKYSNKVTCHWFGSTLHILTVFSLTDYNIFTEKQLWSEQLQWKSLNGNLQKDPCRWNPCRSNNRARCCSVSQMPPCHPAAVLTRHGGPAQTPRVAAEHQPARPRCSPAADWGKAWHVQSKRQHPTCWPTPAFTAALHQVPTRCVHAALESRRKNTLREVVWIHHPLVKLSASHMALAKKKKKKNGAAGCFYNLMLLSTKR